MTQEEMDYLNQRKEIEEHNDGALRRIEQRLKDKYLPVDNKAAGGGDHNPQHGRDHPTSPPASGT